MTLLVVGIGADGWAGLGSAARDGIAECDVLMGSARQLDLVPDSNAERVQWPSPLLPALPGLLERYRGHRVCVLASGDPMFHGIGVTLAKLLGAEQLRVIPHPSSVSIACARLGWSPATSQVVNLVARPVETVLPALRDGARLLALSNDEHTPAVVAKLLSDNGYGQSWLCVLEQLGGPAERRVEGHARDWQHPAGDPLNVIAIECMPDAGVLRLTRLPGLPDQVYGGDGQLTKSEIRTLTVCALAPAPGELLWDVGAGSGSIAIEWCRTDPTCRAVAFERNPARSAQIVKNAAALGVPQIQVLGAAPGALADATDPHAVFIGGGVTADGVLDTCWERLRTGARLVANAVTAESESLLVTSAHTYGGSLHRFQVYRAQPLGTYTTWRPELPVVQWRAVKDH